MSNIKEKIMETAGRFWADLVGFTSVDRLKAISGRSDPQSIFPQAKTVIGLGFRVLRGCYRGVEEGTTYYMYTTIGVETNEETRMPIAMLNVCACIEDEGFEAVPQKDWQLIMNREGDTNPEMNYSKIYRGIALPQLDFRAAAVACGLGEIGASGSILTDSFGPFQRFCFILTDAAIEEDPLYVPHLCDDCGACRAACPGQALREEIDHCCGYNFHVRDNWQCAAYIKGANRTKNPFMPPDALADIPDRADVMRGKKHLSSEEARFVMDRLVYYPPARHSYTFSICGRACDRACYLHLEEKGVLSRTFENPFREASDWALSL